MNEQVRVEIQGVEVAVSVKDKTVVLTAEEARQFASALMDASLEAKESADADAAKRETDAGDAAAAPATAEPEPAESPKADA